ncbi:hypothetical protein LK09_11650 [Microbacterium mangrovi]|uniref:Uncharacterized protein n=1 Tax=Microbacterium mangrovi TaxID=1348253 RepID=A0A0B2A302_9MICO|nr:hypothetical protein LK09_11650 [Microbacterium mangrovi]
MLLALVLPLAACHQTRPTSQTVSSNDSTSTSTANSAADRDWPDTVYRSSNYHPGESFAR